jgi:hypothetical protein
MPQIHICQPGGCLARAAWRYLLQGKVVADHPDNRVLLAKRKDPNMLSTNSLIPVPVQGL